MSQDPTQEFLRSLPEITPDEQFCFACHPKVPCFNACCSDLTMPLLPYDVLRLCQGLEMSSDAFFEEFAHVGCYSDTGFPLLHLRMEDHPGRPCPFVTPKGCGVYENRSSACRTYPLGRATRPKEEQKCELSSQVELLEQYFLVREDHCKGFNEPTSWTRATWLQDQELETYNAMNDRYVRLIAHYKGKTGSGVLLSSKLATMGLLALYQQDRFLDFINSVNLFDKINFIGAWAIEPEQQKERILSDPTERLRFGFEWMELALSGSATHIAPQG